MFLGDLFLLLPDVSDVWRKRTEKPDSICRAGNYLFEALVVWKKIGVFLGLAPPEVTPEEEEWKAILDKTTYSNMDSNKQHIKDR